MRPLTQKTVMKLIVSCVCLVTCFLLQSSDAKTSFQEDRPEWFVNRCVVLPAHGSELVHIILPEAQAKDEIAASQVSIAAYDHLHRRLESWELGHVLNAPTPDYWDGMAPAGMQRLVRWMTVPLKRGMNFIVVRNEAGTPSQEVIPLFCARDFRIFLAPSSKILAGNGLRDKNHPLAISTPTLGWIVGEDAQGSLVFDVSLALEVLNVRYDRSAERLSCRLVFRNTSRQPVEIPVWGQGFALRDQASRIDLLVDDDLLYSGGCFCPDDEVLQGFVPASVQLQPGQSFERDFSFSNVPLPPGRHELMLDLLSESVRSDVFMMAVDSVGTVATCKAGLYAMSVSGAADEVIARTDRLVPDRIETKMQHSEAIEAILRELSKVSDEDVVSYVEAFDRSSLADDKKGLAMGVLLRRLGDRDLLLEVLARIRNVPGSAGWKPLSLHLYECGISAQDIEEVKETEAPGTAKSEHLGWILLEYREGYIPMSSPLTERVPLQSVARQEPIEARSILRALNSWDVKELTLVESSEDNRVRKPSGETITWVDEHKKALNRIGFRAVWDERRLSYRLGVRP